MLWGLVLLGLLIYIINGVVKNKKRRSTPCVFDRFSPKEFEQMAQNASLDFDRIIYVSVNGTDIYGKVRSQSGASTWNFRLDFNDWGHITGTFWIRSDNSDSKIPRAYGRRVRYEIENYTPLKCYGDSMHYCSESYYDEIPFCPFCGSRQLFIGASYCSNCGRRIR